MKAIKLLRAVIVLAGILLSACAPAANSSAPIHIAGAKVQSNIIYTGAIESMSGNQWVINGQTITVDDSVLRDGPFSVGDIVKVEASVAANGSVTAQRVETPSAKDSVEMSTSAPEVSTSVPEVVSTPEANSTPQAPKLDDKGNETVGTVDTVTDASITVGGQTYTFTPGAEIKGTITAGVSVKLHFTTNADGTLSVTEVEITDPTKIEDNHKKDNNSNSTNVSSDHSNASTTSDDHGGVNTNSNDGSNHDANDDHGGGSNSGGDNSSSNSGSGG